MRFPVWGAARAPALGDVACQVSSAGAGDADAIRRAYLVIGIEEGVRPGSYRLLMERVEYGTVPDPPDPRALWHFFRPEV